ncbi:hypothetical protein BASA50_001498 [Batrachochytrium salamandrivorans]|uniref:Uncharacterized protein n=1 Tax=Batrachochytrium salamandrivorans TaxID=1357716 RepID=A0ABQ8FP24_9FUNG|nr:hypothetical protein BASA62_002088 [Batrachochytrium salamandrivorans]KAH6601641.1 hypothetical protein BASA50_001498 [Batrachochytrium salamandrivorans]KAH9269676.1 hypothetical protein BASA83_008337 [Batrachochytrium salamandrivorans]
MPAHPASSVLSTKPYHRDSVEAIETTTPNRVSSSATRTNMFSNFSNRIIHGSRSRATSYSCDNNIINNSNNSHFRGSSSSNNNNSNNSNSNSNSSSSEPKKTVPRTLPPIPRTLVMTEESNTDDSEEVTADPHTTVNPLLQPHPPVDGLSLRSRNRLPSASPALPLHGGVCVPAGTPPLYTSINDHQNNSQHNHQRSTSAPTPRHHTPPHYLEPITPSPMLNPKQKSLSQTGCHPAAPLRSISNFNDSSHLNSTSVQATSSHQRGSASFCHPTLRPSPNSSPYSSRGLELKSSGSSTSIRGMILQPSSLNVISSNHHASMAKIYTTGSASDRSNVFLSTKKDVEFLSKLIQEQGSMDVTQRDKESWTRKVLKMELKSAEKANRQQEKTTRRSDRVDFPLDSSTSSSGFDSVSLSGLHNLNSSSLALSSSITTASAQSTPPNYNSISARISKIGSISKLFMS